MVTTELHMMSHVCRRAQADVCEQSLGIRPDCAMQMWVGVGVTVPLQIPQQGIHISLALPQMPVYLLNGCYLQTHKPQPLTCIMVKHG